MRGEKRTFSKRCFLSPRKKLLINQRSQNIKDRKLASKKIFEGKLQDIEKKAIELLELKKLIVKAVVQWEPMDIVERLILRT